MGDIPDKLSYSSSTPTIEITSYDDAVEVDLELEAERAEALGFAIAQPIPDEVDANVPTALVAERAAQASLGDAAVPAGAEVEIVDAEVVETPKTGEVCSIAGAGTPPISDLTLSPEIAF